MSTPEPRKTPIPTYTPHLRFQVSGQLGPVGSAWEIFSYGISMAGSAPQTGAQVLQDACQDLVEFHQRPETGISAMARVTSVKAAYVLANGKWSGGEALFELTGNFPGGRAQAGSVLVQAPQVAMAVTLRTAQNTARTRGRMFLPLPVWQPLASTATLDPIQGDSVLGSAVTLIQNLNNLPGFDGGNDGVVVASTFGANTPVTGVSVGLVLDTITTRRNKLREAYRYSDV